MGLTQGLLAAMVADTAPAARRGAAFGLFHFVSGVAMIAASLIAGGLWQWYGAKFTFIAGAVFSAVALAGLLWWRFRYAIRTERE
jgi:MFS family permease